MEETANSLGVSTSTLKAKLKIHNIPYTDEEKCKTIIAGINRMKLSAIRVFLSSMNTKTLREVLEFAESNYDNRTYCTFFKHKPFLLLVDELKAR